MSKRKFTILITLMGIILFILLSITPAEIVYSQDSNPTPTAEPPQDPTPPPEEEELPSDLEINVYDTEEEAREALEEEDNELNADTIIQGIQSFLDSLVQQEGLPTDLYEQTWKTDPFNLIDKGPGYAPEVSYHWHTPGDINKNPMQWHQGVDFVVRFNGDGNHTPGIPVAAIADGFVVKPQRAIMSYDGQGWGHRITLAHFMVLDGKLVVRYSAYYHMQSITIDYYDSDGLPTYVEQGQQLGLAGCTGNCGGPHTHFEMNDIAPDEFPYLPDGRVHYYKESDGESGGIIDPNPFIGGTFTMVSPDYVYEHDLLSHLSNLSDVVEGMPAPELNYETIEVEDWTQEVAQVWGKETCPKGVSLPLENVKFIILHETVGSRDADPVAFAEYFRDSAPRGDNQKGWDGFAYHFLIAPDGSIRETLALDCEGYHIPSANTDTWGPVNNSNSWGISFQTDKDVGTITDEQRASAQALVYTLMFNAEIPPENVITHNEVTIHGKLEGGHVDPRDLEIEKFRREIQKEPSIVADIPGVDLPASSQTWSLPSWGPIDGTTSAGMWIIMLILGSVIIIIQLPGEAKSWIYRSEYARIGDYGIRLAKNALILGLVILTIKVLNLSNPAAFDIIYDTFSDGTPDVFYDALEKIYSNKDVLFESVDEIENVNIFSFKGIKTVIDNLDKIKLNIDVVSEEGQLVVTLLPVILDLLKAILTIIVWPLGAITGLNVWYFFELLNEEVQARDERVSGLQWSLRLISIGIIVIYMMVAHSFMHETWGILIKNTTILFFIMFVIDRTLETWLFANPDHPNSILLSFLGALKITLKDFWVVFDFSMAHIFSILGVTMLLATYIPINYIGLGYTKPKVWRSVAVTEDVVHYLQSQGDYDAALFQAIVDAAAIPRDKDGYPAEQGITVPWTLPYAVFVSEVKDSHNLWLPVGFTSPSDIPDTYVTYVDPTKPGVWGKTLCVDGIYARFPPNKSDYNDTVREASLLVYASIASDPEMKELWPNITANNIYCSRTGDMGRLQYQPFHFANIDTDGNGKIQGRERAILDGMEGYNLWTNPNTVAEAVVRLFAKCYSDSNGDARATVACYHGGYDEQNPQYLNNIMAKITSLETTWEDQFTTDITTIDTTETTGETVYTKPTVSVNISANNEVYDTLLLRTIAQWRSEPDLKGFPKIGLFLAEICAKVGYKLVFDFAFENSEPGSLKVRNFIAENALIMEYLDKEIKPFVESRVSINLTNRHALVQYNEPISDNIRWLLANQAGIAEKYLYLDGSVNWAELRSAEFEGKIQLELGKKWDLLNSEESQIRLGIDDLQVVATDPYRGLSDIATALRVLAIKTSTIETWCGECGTQVPQVAGYELSDSVLINPDRPDTATLQLRASNDFTINFSVSSVNEANTVTFWIIE